MPTILLHIQNDDPVLGEVDALPNPGDSLIARVRRSSVGRMEKISIIWIVM